MNLYIDDLQTVSDLQESFQHGFPFLKIEFCDAPPHQVLQLGCESCIAPDKQIGQIRAKHNAGYLEIGPGYTTASLVWIFWKKFGLNIRVFRKENDSWVQSTSSDRLTLKEQSDLVFNTSHSTTAKHQ